VSGGFTSGWGLSMARKHMHAVTVVSGSASR
jgi:hypothetical protein